MTIHDLDAMPVAEKKALLLKCCGSSAWVNKMLDVFPVEDLVDLLNAAEEKWYECSEDDWKEAFSHHPKIGETRLREKFTTTAGWAEDEQGGMKDANDGTIISLLEKNDAYEKKFGYIFIICATGKQAADMLTTLNERLQNDAGKELQIAADEQNKITQLRLQKLFL